MLRDYWTGGSALSALVHQQIDEQHFRDLCFVACIGEGTRHQGEVSLSTAFLGQLLTEIQFRSSLAMFRLEVIIASQCLARSPPSCSDIYGGDTDEGTEKRITSWWC